MFVNWGSEDQVTEFNGKGEVIFHAYLESGERQQHTQNYRAFKGNWTGYSPETPAVAFAAGSDGRTSVYVSWNGDTRTVLWRFSWSGVADRSLQALSSHDVPKEGFETRFDIPGASQINDVHIEALDEHGNVLVRSVWTRSGHNELKEVSPLDEPGALGPISTTGQKILGG